MKFSAKPAATTRPPANAIGAPLELATIRNPTLITNIFSPTKAKAASDLDNNSFMLPIPFNVTNRTIHVTHSISLVYSVVGYAALVMDVPKNM
jgi:hypothetical protein